MDGQDQQSAADQPNNLLAEGHLSIVNSQQKHVSGHACNLYDFSSVSMVELVGGTQGQGGSGNVRGIFHFLRYSFFLTMGRRSILYQMMALYFNFIRKHDEGNGDDAVGQRRTYATRQTHIRKPEETGLTMDH